MTHPVYSGMAVLVASGFRPFFLGAVVQAVLGAVVWAGLFAHGMPFPKAMIPPLWHGHEMVFGFAGAAVGGFLLTAVPNWTGRTPIHGWRLGAMAALWLLGRIACGLIDHLPAGVVALADLPFLPVLTYFIGREIVLAKNERNYMFIWFLGSFALGNLMVHMDLLGLAPGAAAKGTYLGLYAVVVMLTVITGRIIPSFTTNGLRMQGINLNAGTPPQVETGAVLAALAALVSDLGLGSGTITGLASLVAALLLGLRMREWGTLKTFKMPIVWVLHLGHAWLVFAFALKALADLTGLVPPTVPLHAFTAGAIAVMLIAVGSRAALGHSGRPLVLPKGVPAAYLLIAGGALIRVLGPVLLPGQLLWVIAASAIVWAAGFALFGVIYWPILTKPRLDGRPG